MGEKLIEFLSMLLYQVELIIIGAVLFRNETKKISRYITAGFLYFLFMPVTCFCFGDGIILTLDAALSLLLYFFLFEGKWTKKIFSFGEIYSLTGLVNGIFDSLLSVIMIPEKNFVGRCCFYIIIICTMLGLERYQKDTLKKVCDYLDALNRRQHIGITVFIFCGSILLSVSIVVFEYLNSNYFLWLIQFITLIFILILMTGVFYFTKEIYQRDYYQKQVFLMRELLQNQEDYYKTRYEKDREMRSFRHDIREQLGCLHLLLEKGELEKAGKYLEAMEGGFRKGLSYQYHVGNELLDMIISQCGNGLKEKNIAYKVDGRLTGVENINIYDLCTIFSNAIKNAVEACEGMDGEEKEIKITLKEHCGTYFFCFANSATKEMYEALVSNRTTKQDKYNHGFGVKNIESAVKRSGGQMEYRFEEGKVCLEIYFMADAMQSVPDFDIL